MLRNSVFIDSEVGDSHNLFIIEYFQVRPWKTGLWILTASYSEITMTEGNIHQFQLAIKLWKSAKIDGMHNDYNALLYFIKENRQVSLLI